jgi:hypothetical protein
MLGKVGTSAGMPLPRGSKWNPIPQWSETAVIVDSARVLILRLGKGQSLLQLAMHI